MQPVYIITIIALVGALARFFFENHKFVKHHPEYKGKYLWSLLYFPGVYLIVLMLEFLVILMYAVMYMSMGIWGSLFQNLFIWLVIMGGIVAWSMQRVYRTRSNLREMLMEWQPGNEKSALRNVESIISIGTLVPFLGMFLLSMAARQETMAGYAFDNELGRLQPQILLLFLGATVCGVVIWLFARHKINTLKSEIAVRVFNMSAPTYQKPTEQKRSGAEKLKEAKALFDDGILSEDEFSRLKKEILREGI